MDDILRILTQNARESTADIARQLDCEEAEVLSRIEEMEEKGIIKGYQAIVDYDQLEREGVTAVIEVKVTPEREGGFDHVARRIARFDEVSSMYLVSGAFDLLVFINGSDLRKVAGFVSEKLSTMEGITSTATHFMLKTYKQHGVLMDIHDDNEQLDISP